MTEKKVVKKKKTTRRKVSRKKINQKIESLAEHKALEMANRINTVAQVCSNRIKEIAKEYGLDLDTDIFIKDVE